jgi:hypothetical protein
MPTEPTFEQPEVEPSDGTVQENSTTDSPPEGEDVDSFLGRGRDNAPWHWRNQFY